MTTDRRSFGVMLAGAAAFFDLYAPQSILPQLAADFGVSGHQAGWVITVTSLAVALIGPFAGALADVFGRKRLIVAGALAMVVPTILAAVAATFAELLIWRTAAGLLMPLIFCVTIGHIGEEWDAGESRAVTALYVAGAVAGGFFGRFLTGVVTDALSWRAAFASLGAVNLAIGLALLRMLPRERSFTTSNGVRTALAAMLAHLRRPHMLAACVVGSLILFAQVALFTYANLLVAGPSYGLRPGRLALISAVYLLGMMSTPLAGSCLRGFQESVPLSTGAALFIAGAGLTLLLSLWMIIAGLALASAGTFLSQSAATSFVAGAARGAVRRDRHLHEFLLHRRQHRGGGARCGVAWGRLARSGCAADRPQPRRSVHRRDLLAHACSPAHVARQISRCRPGDVRSIRRLRRMSPATGLASGLIVIATAGSRPRSSPRVRSHPA